MFIRLALINMSRNLARSISSMISLALAAIVLTASLSIGRGYPQNAYGDFRAVIGGEIIAHSLPFAARGLESTVDSRLSYLTLEQDTNLSVFHPELELPGFVTQFSGAVQPFASDQLAKLTQHPGVGAAKPLYQLPAYTIFDEQFAPRYITPVRGIEIGVEPPPIDDLIVEGRSFSASDEGQPVAIINKWRKNLPFGVETPAIGSKVVVTIPTIEIVGDSLVYNYDKTVTRELEIIGHYEVLTRILSWETPLGSDYEEIYWHSNEIFIPLTTWQVLYAQVGEAEYPPYQVSLQVPDMNYLDDVLIGLRSAFPNYSFESVPTVINQAIGRGLIEVIYRAPPSARGHTEEARQSGIPTDLRSVTIVLVFANCTLIAAVNSLLAIRERRTELATLRTIGARGADLITMIISELCMVSLAGAFIGFCTVRLFGVINQLSNGHSLATIALSTGRDMLIVLGLTLSSSLLFALVPAISATRQTARSLLSGD